MKSYLLSLLLFFLSLLVVGGRPVLAQTDVALKTDLIWQKEQLDDEINKTRQFYNQQLGNYRAQAKQRRIALDQYQSLNTLAALDDLVLKTKNLALSRDLVLTHYFNLLKLNLYASEGVELSLKDQYLSTLDQGIEFLKTHYAVLELANTKDELELSLNSFQDLGDPNSFSQKILALLAIARLQRIYDLAIPLKADIDDFLQTKNNLDLLVLERASTETNRALDNAQVNLENLWGEAADSGSLMNVYRNLTKELNPSYVSLSQSLVYFRELLDFN